ncbi:biotin/lipoyl-binding protein [Aerophototrophica crusticola]|uniref:Biotin/lipoyl-binding protein n=1 Tax=Aerophototrophica crusticola TaxID=1709002 RepID=A0A858R753_9PROT|nr:biotin/lipoyl-binding protein [Rhodospirillaceae bacterium B3]
MSFRRILIANRGEIACRIARTAKRLGYGTVAVYSDADAGALHTRLADQAVRIGPAAAAQSYLSIPALLDAARRSGADAVHPGYGFLSENADFAQAVVEAGLVFIGPAPSAIRAMGSKRLAKERVAAHGVPVLPGYTGADQSLDRLVGEAGRIGLPLMVKASAGGGGKGLRPVRDPAELRPALERAAAEALASFGDGELILERALLDPRHVEIQIFGDRHGNIIHLGERDCSVQRRHQKVVEEAPSPALTPELRAEMGAAAVAAACTVDYVGAGTVEFLLDGDGRFYFMEMNTRLQVEHPVTEAITGLDLVEWQLRVAAGEPLPLAQDQVRSCGHAIEVRLYAEDAGRGFLPQTGPVLAWVPPDGVRVDHGLVEGQPVTPHYDPMLAKLIASGATREEARRRLVRALGETRLHGVVTNRAFLAQVLETPAFVEGRATTGLLNDFVVGDAAPDLVVQAIAAAILAGKLGWWSHGTPTARLRLAWDGGEALAAVTPEGVAVGGETLAVSLVGECGGQATVTVDGGTHTLPVTRDGNALWLDWQGRTYVLEDAPLSKAAKRDGAAADTVLSPMPGTVVELAVEAGQAVAKGQKLMVLEAMKMQLELKAPAAGVVAELPVRQGQQVPARALLARLDLGGEGL